MPKKPQISDEHKKDMVAFFRSRLAHVLDLGYDLQLLGDNIPKYIRIGSAQRDFRRLYVRKMMMKITLRQR